MKRMILLTLATATPAQAHPGDHSASGLPHFLTEPDHLALMALALAVVIGLVVKRRARR